MIAKCSLADRIKWNRKTAHFGCLPWLKKVACLCSLLLNRCGTYRIENMLYKQSSVSWSSSHTYILILYLRQLKWKEKFVQEEELKAATSSSWSLVLAASEINVSVLFMHGQKTSRSDLAASQYRLLAIPGWHSWCCQLSPPWHNSASCHEVNSLPQNIQ